MDRQFLALVITRVLQAMVAWYFAFGLTTTLRIPQEQILIAFSIFAAVAIWGVGLGCEYLFYKKTRSAFDAAPMVMVGAAIGAALVLVPSFQFGLRSLILPIIGGVTAYHFSGKRAD